MKRIIFIALVLLTAPSLAHSIDIDLDSNDATDIAYGGTNAVTAAAAYANIKQAASETATGAVELATTAEAVTGTDTARAVTPAGLTSRLAAPSAIGGITPDTGAFTTVTATTYQSNAADGARSSIYPENTAYTPGAGEESIYNVAGDMRLAESGAEVGSLAVTTDISTAITTERAASATLTNKTMAAGSNTFSDMPVELCVAISDETTALTTGTAKVTVRAPWAFTLTDVRSSVTTAPTGANLNIDINESGVSVLSTVLSIDATELTSTTATTAAVISDSAIADDAPISFDIDQIGSTVAGTGGKVCLYGIRSY